MKICVPTKNDRGPASEAFDHFGDAPFFAIADVDTGEIKVVRNPECHDEPHACHHVSLLQAHAVQAVACEGIGRRAFAGLREAGIDVIVPASRDGRGRRGDRARRRNQPSLGRRGVRRGSASPRASRRGRPRP
jgi:predicted Fe-Mo cluster-binding NifX family protein